MTYRTLILAAYGIAAMLTTLALMVFATEPVGAHSWYPNVCCSDKDCAPVMSIQQVPEGRIVTSEHGSVLVPTNFHAQLSQDSDFHVCMQPSQSMDGGDDGGMILICWFEPSGS